MHLAELLASRVDRVNPRHRRLVIPVALVALLLVVVIAAVVASERAPAPRAEPDARLHPRPRRPGQGGRLRAAEGRAAHLAPRRAAVRRPQGRPAPADHDVRRHPGASPPTTPSATRRATPSTRCWTSRSATGTSTRPRRATRCGSPRSSRRSCTPPTARTRWRPTAATTATSRGCWPRTTRSSSRSASPTRTASSSRAGRRSTARSRSSCGCSTPRSPTRCEKGHLRKPTPEDPLRIVDLGCGNAYLTFAARALPAAPRLPVRLTGVDVKEQSREHNSAVAAELGIDADFVVGTIGGVALDPAPEVVLALHACDTATDEALARAVEWGAQLVLAAPCCHHDIAAQLRKAPTPAPYADADPARHPPRAARRHPDRRAARVADAAAGLPRRRRAVRREPAHAAQHDAARGPHRRPGQGRLGAQGVRRDGRRPGACGPSSPSCSS